MAQVGRKPILVEIESLWPEAFEQTSRARYRSDHDGKTLSVMFLMTHYVMEKLRETQLKSFWRNRLDANGNGKLEWEERWALIKLVEDWNLCQGEHTRSDMILKTTDSASRPLHWITARLSWDQGHPHRLCLHHHHRHPILIWRQSTCSQRQFLSIDYRG